jgi:hypothetical protein
MTLNVVCDFVCPIILDVHCYSREVNFTKDITLHGVRNYFYL